MSQLFTLPILTGGNITCTSPSPQIYLLTFTSPPDNRLTTPFITTLLLALDILEHRYPTGVVITTSSIQKFYSNGLDLDHVSKTDGFFPKTFHPLLARFLTYPMPTIALINGHAFAGGLILAAHHDYRFQNPTRGFLSLNEILFGMVMSQALISAIREKVPPKTFRSLVLEGRRFGAQESLEEGLVDGVGGLEEVLEFVRTRDLVRMGRSGVYGKMKENMYRRSVDVLVNAEEDVRAMRVLGFERLEKAREARKRIEVWEREGGKAKL